jgi:hypothetical protein
MRSQTAGNGKSVHETQDLQRVYELGCAARRNTMNYVKSCVTRRRGERGERGELHTKRVSITTSRDSLEKAALNATMSVLSGFPQELGSCW